MVLAAPPLTRGAFLSRCCDKIPNASNLSKKGFVVTHSGAYSPSWNRSVSPLVLQRDECWCSAQCFICILSLRHHPPPGPPIVLSVFSGGQRGGFLALLPDLESLSWADHCVQLPIRSVSLGHVLPGAVPILRLFLCLSSLAFRDGAACRSVHLSFLLCNLSDCSRDLRCLPVC